MMNKKRIASPIFLFSFLALLLGASSSFAISQTRIGAISTFSTDCISPSSPLVADTHRGSLPRSSDLASDFSVAARGGVPSLVNLNRQLAAQEIAGGHAFVKHAAEFGFKTEAQMAAHIENVMANPTMMRSLSNGRTAFWNEATGTVIIRNPAAVDGGTAFIPKNGLDYFLNLR